jgi:nucleoid-associated protein YgaU
MLINPLHPLHPLQGTLDYRFDHRLCLYIDPQIRGDVTKYTVQPGDTLAKIFIRFYQDSTKGRLILEASRDLLISPNKLTAGIVLKIPSIT